MRYGFPNNTSLSAKGIKWHPTLLPFLNTRSSYNHWHKTSTVSPVFTVSSHRRGRHTWFLRPMPHNFHQEEEKTCSIFDWIACVMQNDLMLRMRAILKTLRKSRRKKKNKNKYIPAKAMWMRNGRKRNFKRWPMLKFGSKKTKKLLWFFFWGVGEDTKISQWFIASVSPNIRPLKAVLGRPAQQTRSADLSKRLETLPH